ncbi:phage baseplate assembly protein V [Variovorax sp. LjRoot84]|uniref:phage baseplate assembly protein V n=1 Tax=Variovorax sp. LjRoot84 TaxID=3342340 RepID=UPI003ECEDC83
MDEALFERLEQLGPESVTEGFAIAPGIVTNNLDAISEGRVQVRIPSIPAMEPWARMPSMGGGSGRGFLWIPQINDEVLVAFAQNDASAAYVLGGLWSTADRPPLTLPNDFLVKRVIKTGMAGGLGHEVVFDDLTQSITITSSTQQKITIDPLSIKIENTAGTLSIALDNASQTVSVQSALKIELKATQISLEGVQVDIKGSMVNIQSSGPCTVQGLPIKLN